MCVNVKLFLFQVASHFLSAVFEEHLNIPYPVNKSFPCTVLRMRQTNSLRRLDNTHSHSVYVQTLMGIPPAGSFTDSYLRAAHAANRPLPIFPLPHHLIQEKPVPVDIFHTLSSIFLADWDCVGRDPSVIFSHGSFSYCQLPQQRPDGPV